MPPFPTAPVYGWHRPHSSHCGLQIFRPLRRLRNRFRPLFTIHYPLFTISANILKMKTYRTIAGLTSFFPKTQMKYVLTIFIFLSLSSQCLAQGKPQVKADPVTECTVNFVYDIEKAAKSDDKGMEVGRFTPTYGGEGTHTVKRFRVGKLNFYIFASVLYEDDLWYDGIPHDAMTLELSITKSAKENPRLWLAYSGMQIDDREDFGAAKISTLVKRKSRNSLITMNCQRKEVVN